MTGTLTSSVRTSQRESVQGLGTIAESFTIIRCWGCRESGRSESRMTRVRSILSSRQQSVSVMENTASQTKIQSGLARDSESIELHKPIKVRSISQPFYAGLRAPMLGDISLQRSWVTLTTGEFLQPTLAGDQCRTLTWRRETRKPLLE